MISRLATVLLSATGVLALAGCGAGATSTIVTRHTRTALNTVAAGAPTTPPTTTAPRPDPAPPPPSYPRLLAGALGSSPSAFVPAASWRGHTAVWIARSPSGVALLSFDQRLVELRLHSGTVDAGGSGWRFGPAVLGTELGRLIAAFNGGFKFSTGAGGFESYGRLGAPLGDGLGSIITYTNGRTNIGAWNAGVPAAGTPVASVRQNLTLRSTTGPQPRASIASRAGARRSAGSATPPARHSASPPTGVSCGPAAST